jgi:hypothetical protein
LRQGIRTVNSNPSVEEAAVGEGIPGEKNGGGGNDELAIAEGAAAIARMEKTILPGDFRR